jgi:hypothetical protein
MFCAAALAILIASRLCSAALPAAQWIDAQNAYTDAVMAGFTDAASIAKRVGALALTSTQRSDPKLVGGVLFYLRQTPPQPQAVLVAESWPQGEPKVLQRVGNTAVMLSFFAKQLGLGPATGRHAGRPVISPRG